MNQEKNQPSSPSTLLEGIQGEVSDENAPLLRFITKHAGLIAGVVLAILLILGGMAIWNWYHGGKQQEALAELARINSELQGAAKEKALEALALTAPASTRLFIYMTLAQSAQENGNPKLAGEAYAQAAALAGDGPLGMAAALGSAGALLTQGQYAQALDLLQKFEQKWPEAAQSRQLRQLMAEAAVHAGKLELARDIYQSLGQPANSPESAYFQSRADALTAKIAQSGKAAGR